MDQRPDGDALHPENDRVHLTAAGRAAAPSLTVVLMGCDLQRHLRAVSDLSTAPSARCERRQGGSG